MELNLPLLTHAGAERSFTHARDELADPVRLKLPLDLGVKVIVAHAASTGENEGEEDIDRLIAMLETYPNLFADISSMTQINKHRGGVAVVFSAKPDPGADADDQLDRKSLGS